MKLITATLLLASLFAFTACNSDNSKKNEDGKETSGIVGSWVLFKEVKHGKENDYSGKPVAVSLTLKENGFFIYYDRITDDKISTDVDQIQERFKGQYEYSKDLLKLNHFIEDSLLISEYKVESLSDNELVLMDPRTKNVQYFKK